MPQLTVNGKQIEAKPGQTVIQAARDNGIYIPHYCWHPGLSVAGNCRMCLVEIEKAPKPQIACSTLAAEGMVVHTDSPAAVHSREAVMEFLLINHPLDCPICDEAGQCKLQDYTMRFSAGVSRFEEEKVHKPKRQEISPHIMLDDERCIMCSRCVRFGEEIAHQPAFTFTERNDHVTLTVFPGTQFDNDYSMNVIDICPVGALTSRDFRFASRVWDMSWTDSVCPGCARGCDIRIGARNNAILRIDPRTNMQVNEWWICDHGRLESWRNVHAETRIHAPYIRENGNSQVIAWKEAFTRVAALLKKYKSSEIACIASPFATNEDNYLFRRFSREVLNTQSVALPEHISGKNDELLIRADRTPNDKGARLIASPAMSRDELLAAIERKQIKCLYIIDEDVAAWSGAKAGLLKNVETVIVQSSNENATTAAAAVVLPSATFAEIEGTFTNFKGFVQLLAPAIATVENASRVGLQQSRLDKAGTEFDRWATSNKCDALPHWKILQGVAAAAGEHWQYRNAEHVFEEIARKIPAFAGLSYESMEETNGASLAIRLPDEKVLV